MGKLPSSHCEGNGISSPARDNTSSAGPAQRRDDRATHPLQDPRSGPRSHPNGKPRKQKRSSPSRRKAVWNPMPPRPECALVMCGPSILGGRALPRQAHALAAACVEMGVWRLHAALW